jgi:acetyl-CoA carboxylase biotin carboxylase subunit
MFEKILIANRGEIALRVLRACRDMGIRTVAVHSTADAESMHVRLADESVCIGPPSGTESYLNKAAVISAAMVTNSDAIHPGYGFLSENADFAEMVEEHGITFIGPTPEHIRVMGDKVQAKIAAQKAGIPVVPGSDGAVESPEEAIKVGAEIGYPVLIKASAGGGGRGMKVAETADDVVEAFKVASGEAKSAFGNGEVYMEKYLSKPRHIEIQVLADSHGNVVHLGERDCSLQRKHQKVLEESPSPALNSSERERIGQVVCEAMRNIGYRNAGTVEFLYENGEFYFIEMNTRLQAEDPVTFTPSPGQVTGYHMPGGLGVRVDSGLFSGAKIPPYYDSMVAKLIVHGRSRNECLMRLRRALSEYVIDGVTTTIPLHEKLINAQDFIDGNYDIRWLEEFVLGDDQKANR